MLFPRKHTDRELAEQATEAAELAVCPQCEVLTPHQVEQVAEVLNSRQQLVHGCCEVCGESHLLFI